MSYKGVMMRIDECRILIVREGYDLIGSLVGWRWGIAGLRVDYNPCMLPGSRVGDAAHF